MSVNEVPFDFGYCSGPKGAGQQLTAYILFFHGKKAHAAKSGIGKGKIGCSCEDGLVHGDTPHGEFGLL